MAKHRSSPQPPRRILSLQNLGIQRDRCRILSGVNWTVHTGQHWALLGANGSGKTSLLKALTGYLMPTTGTIELLGQTYGQSDWRELRRSVGIVSPAIGQMIPDREPALRTVMSGPPGLIGWWDRGLDPSPTAARHVLRQVGCGPLARRQWAVLSQGERQRVLIARALLGQPALLVLDEPCAGLDPVAREHFLQFLDRLGRQPECPTLVLVTHHVEEIMPVFTHVLVLKDGRIVTAAPRSKGLTSAVLETAFGAGVRVRTGTNGRSVLTVTSDTGRVL